MESRTSLLTLKQAAAHLGCSVRHLRKLIDSGVLPSVNVGLGAVRKTPRVRVEDLDLISKPPGERS